MSWLGYLLAITAGLSNPVQSGANAQLNKSLQQPVMAALVVYVTGLAGLLIATFFSHGLRAALDKAGQVPWWAWAGGVLSLLPTITALTIARKLGSGTFTGISVTTAILCSVALDHFGWVGFEVHPASLWRIAGCALMIGGLFLVMKF